jgi:hypothetical protein
MQNICNNPIELEMSLICIKIFNLDQKYVFNQKSLPLQNVFLNLNPISLTNNLQAN